VQLSDPGAFRVFYDEALPRVYSYLFHRCGRVTEIAEDLTQETFLAAVREMKKRRTVKHPLAWILGIARHKLVDHYRRQKRDKREVAMSLEEKSEAHQVAWVDEESGEQAVAALEAMPASQRAALILRYLDGMSVPEVAHAVGRSVRATESILARGRENFRRVYLEMNNG
jgi:RNA polymerase sigma-70 factor (ECF subfamily)